MHKSEVARFREQQALEEQAARQGLYGTMIGASHAFITARLEICTKRLLKLCDEGQYEEAFRIMELPSWGFDEEENSCSPAT